MRITCLLLLALAAISASSVSPAKPPATADARAFVTKHCAECHAGDNVKGGFDLAKLPADPASGGRWVNVYDRVAAGEMPPRKKRPDGEREFLASVSASIRDRERREDATAGRAVLRRLSRTEYENTVRDLFGLPGLDVKDLLPDDGRVDGYDKVSSALDVSVVHLAKYMEAADVILDAATAATVEAPARVKHRTWAHRGDALELLRNGAAIAFTPDRKRDERLAVVKETVPNNHGWIEKTFKDGVTAGIFRPTDESYGGRFNRFAIRHPGTYRITLSVWSFAWDKGRVVPHARNEVASLRTNPTGRLLGMFDAPPDRPTVHTIEVPLRFGEILVFDVASLWRARIDEFKDRTAGFSGPGIALDYIDIEGPIHPAWPPASHRALYGGEPLVPMDALPKSQRVARPDPNRNIPYAENSAGKYVLASMKPADPLAAARSRLAAFLPKLFRRDVGDETLSRYLGIAKSRLDAGAGYEQAMRVAFKAALCSPDFLYLRESPGKLDDFALASRLSYWLTASTPDDTLLSLARTGKLSDPRTLRVQTDRLLDSPNGKRFLADFADQWLDLRDIDLTSPDRTLYPEFTAYLRDSMQAEPAAFLGELVAKNLPARNLIASDFVTINQKLAEHYGVPGVVGQALRHVSLPADSPRGGVLTQAAILKVTANGTTTSPVKRGAWVLRKILGKPPEPPPPDIPAVEPDVRGTTTIREQLAKHRANASCNACHAKMDPPGFALEAFDPVGGFRTRYRSTGKGDSPKGVAPYYVHIGWKHGPAVDASGETAGGRSFKDIEEFRKILIADGRAVARNLANRLAQYATGCRVRFSDRDKIEAVLDAARASGYGVRDVVRGVVASELFTRK